MIIYMQSCSTKKVSWSQKLVEVDSKIYVLVTEFPSRQLHVQS